MNKQDLIKHLKAAEFQIGKLAEKLREEKERKENMYKDYKKLIWRIYWK